MTESAYCAVLMLELAKTFDGKFSTTEYSL